MKVSRLVSTKKRFKSDSKTSGCGHGIASASDFYLNKEAITTPSPLHPTAHTAA